MNNIAPDGFGSMSLRVVAPATSTPSPQMTDRKARHRSKEERLARIRRWQRIERAILLPVLVIVFAGMFVFKMGQVQGKSMAPLYQTGDHLLLLKPWQLLSPVKVGDIVVVKLNHGKYKGEEWVKRVVYVQNSSGNAPWPKTVQTSITRIFPQRWFADYVRGENRIPPKHILVMGDNYMNSTDSRDDDIGAIAPDEVEGKVIQVWTTDKNYEAAAL